MISKKEFQSNKSGMIMALKGLKTEQLTENCVIIYYDDIDIVIEMSLFGVKKLKKDLDVQAWFDKQPENKKREYRHLFDGFIDSTLNMRMNGSELKRTFTCDPIPSENKQIMGYFFTITLKK